ncbi:MAG: class II aldolase and adducin N-terminal domain-containing protein [Arcobacteraceae bacterium]|nr:class II aldolase and adducin N-terminal domain-containing protein [Arcobacteraceae bacterium]
MVNKNLEELLSNISLTLFRKNFFGIYHGSISAKLDYTNFVINTSDAIFDRIDNKTLCKLASIEADIHASIYNHIHEAKYIAFGMPPYTTACTLKHDVIECEDYFGKTLYDKIPVYDPGDFNTWYSRNSLEVTKFLKESPHHIMVIKGIGVYVYDRDIHELVKKVAILENSCRLLSLKRLF